MHASPCSGYALVYGRGFTRHPYHTTLSNRPITLDVFLGANWTSPLPDRKDRVLPVKGVAGKRSIRSGGGRPAAVWRRKAAISLKHPVATTNQRGYAFEGEPVSGHDGGCVHPGVLPDVGHGFGQRHQRCERFLGRHVVAAGIGFVALQVDAQGGPLGAGAREAKHQARAILQDHAHALLPAHAAGRDQVVGFAEA